MGIPGCHYCEPRLRALLDGELLEEEVGRVREHLADCAACQDVLAAFAVVSDLVSAEPAALEPPPHFSPNLQLRLTSVRRNRVPFGLGWGRPRWSRRYSLAGVTVAGTVVALIVGAPPRLGAQDLVGRVQESWSRLQSYSCRFIAEGIVAGKPRHFVQQQWFRKPNLFRLETNEHYPEWTIVAADRVTSIIPGADWHGRRLAITRPRHPREEGLPFPFGAEWPLSYDVTMDALVRELRSQQGGELLGTEEVQGRLCYVLKFHTQRNGNQRPKHYRVWVDRDTFLPLQVKSYLDTQHQTLSIATDLHTDVMLPDEMFRYTPSRDTFQVYGEVESFVFTLPMDRPRTPDFDEEPISATRTEMLRRSKILTFSPLAPSYLPDGYGLVRVRASAASGWLDAHWLNERTGMVIKLWEQREGHDLGPAEGDGIPVRIDADGVWGRWREFRRPAPLQYLTWTRDGLLFRLAAAGIDRDEALRLAASLSPVPTPDALPLRQARLEIDRGKS
jgi:outer membrane lipoprotein-sorting protein